MNDEWKGVLFIGAIVLFLVWIGWMAYQHPCIQYQAVFVPGHYETRFVTNYCGKDCQITVPYQEWENPHWKQECMAYGDRSKGDVTAAYAPIPAEKQ